jgi:hypothetical protein
MRAHQSQYNPPIRIEADKLWAGRYFFHRLQLYSRCTPEQETGHPAHGESGVLALHYPDNSAEPVPVRFRDDTPVYPATYVNGSWGLTYRKQRRR